MITGKIKNNRNSPQVLVENKLTFAAHECELGIYDTYQQAERVALSSDQILFCGMVTGKKIMHAENDHYQSAFLPHESFVIAPNKKVEIDFPIAQINDPTTCIAIEISKDKVQQISQKLDQHIVMPKEFGQWQYQEELLHTHHTSETQILLNRIVHIFTENHPDRNYLVELAITELTVRLLRHQARDFLVSFSRQQPDHNGLNAVLTYMEQHLSENIEVESLCRIACMSRSRFYTQFKLQLGCTPIALQQQLRLKKATTMLKQQLSITQVCFDLGFINTSHFSRSFKSFYGMTPSQYKLRHQPKKIHHQH